MVYRNKERRYWLVPYELCRTYLINFSPSVICEKHQIIKRNKCSIFVQRNTQLLRKQFWHFFGFHLKATTLTLSLSVLLFTQHNMFSRVCNTILRASCSLVPSRQLSSSARDGLTKILAKRGTQSPRWPYNFSNSNVRIVNEFTELSKF